MCFVNGQVKTDPLSQRNCLVEGQQRIEICELANHYYGRRASSSMFEFEGGLFAEGDDCEHSLAWALPVLEQDWYNQFGIQHALDFVSCPNPWVLNGEVDATRLGKSVSSLNLEAPAV